MTLHPVLDQMITMMNGLNLPAPAEQTPEEMRAQMAKMAELAPPRPMRDVASVEDHLFDGPEGPLTVRVYSPVGDQPVARIVYFHGGGWVLGTVESFDPLCRSLCAASGAEVISVDYRLAPEAPFPAAIDDGFAVLKAATSQSDIPVFVGGDSAGGNIASVLALRARDEGGPDIAGQILYYPVTDHDLERRSYKENGDAGLIVSTADMAWFWGHYVAETANRSHQYASPLRAEDHSNLPPAFLVTAGYDPLRDEGIAYGEALERAKTPVVAQQYADMTHGFCSFTGVVDTADSAIDATGEWLRERVKGAT